MRIESLEITNFKNLRHLRVDGLPQLIVLAGPNGSGKTAVFEALRIFKEAISPSLMAGSKGPDQLLQRLGPVIASGKDRAKIEVSISMTEAEREALDISEHRFQSGLMTVPVSVTRNSYGWESTQPNTYSDQFVPLKELFGGHSPSGELIAAIDHIPPDRSFPTDVPGEVSFSFESRRAELLGLVAESETKFEGLLSDLVRMRLLDMQDYERGGTDPHRRMETVREIFRYFLPDKEFLGVEFTGDLTRPPQIRVRSSRVEHDIQRLSSGEREILMTYTHLEKLGHRGSVILFDEPELHLHPMLQRRVIEYLRGFIERGGNQVWLITHSEEIVGSTDYGSLFAMTGRGAPAVVPVSDRAAQVDLLRQLGATIGLQLVSSRIFFVEGKSDAELLPFFFGELAYQVSFVDTGGKGKLMRLTPAAMRLLDRTMTEGRFYFVRDRDVEEDPGRLDELEEKHSGYFFTWDRYHIENYLLDEEAIYQVLSVVPGIKSPPESAIAIDHHLRALADGHRDKVLAMRLEANLSRGLYKRLSLDPAGDVKTALLSSAEERMRATIELLDPDKVRRLYDEAAEELNSRWDAEWKSLCVGRRVLKVYHNQHVHPHLSYEQFSHEVARKIRELDRIPGRIREVIAAVTSDRTSAQRAREWKS